MKIGDLVCYNAAGQKHKSMALVVGLDNRSKSPLYEHNCVQLMWVMLPEVGPKIERAIGADWEGLTGSFSRLFRGSDDMLRANDNIVLWHPIGDWFEVIQCK